MNLDALQSQIPARLLTAAHDMAPFLEDWRGRWRGRALAVAQPADAAQVQAIVRWCAAHGVPIVAQGGNTGLVGAGVPDGSGRALLLSLARMNAVRRTDPVNGTVTAEAGCRLADLQELAARHGRLFPLSLASEGTCTLGGNLSTNAGGVQVLRYGNARELCLGLEVVTAEGELWSSLRGLRKDNTGYDLRDLFIGAEGTLGIITAATMKLFPRPAAQVTAFVALAETQQAVRLFEMAQRHLGGALTAFELVDDRCVALAQHHFPSQCRRPLPIACASWVLIECGDGRDEARARAACEALLSEALQAECALDAVVAGSLSQARELWRLRELSAEAQVKQGPNFKHDISLPISEIAQFIERMRVDLAKAFPGTELLVFGHIGDGNLHFNVAPPAGLRGAAFEEMEARVNRHVYDAVDAAGGSFSAEHGVGQAKIDEVRRYKPAVELGLMRRIKRALDPQGLMNPGKVLDV